MSNQNGLLGQKLCHCLNQGRTLIDILMRAAHWMAYFDVSKLNLVYTNVMKAFKSKMQWCRRDTVVLRTTCVKNVKFKIIKKDRLSIFGILSPQRKPQLGRTKPLTGPHAARGLDIAGQDKLIQTWANYGPLNSWTQHIELVKIILISQFICLHLIDIVYTPVVPKLVRTVTQIKVAILSYCPQ